MNNRRECTIISLPVVLSVRKSVMRVPVVPVKTVQTQRIGVNGVVRAKRMNAVMIPVSLKHVQSLVRYGMRILVNVNLLVKTDKIAVRANVSILSVQGVLTSTKKLVRV